MAYMCIKIRGAECTGCGDCQPEEIEEEQEQEKADEE